MRCSAPRLQVAAQALLALDGLEQRLEVPRAEALGALPLDDLVEHGRTVLHRLGEDLEQVAVRIAVDQDSQLRKGLDILIDLPDALLEVVVVGRRYAEELDATL